MKKIVLLVGLLALAGAAQAQTIEEQVNTNTNGRVGNTYRIETLEGMAAETDSEQAVQDNRLDIIEGEQAVQNDRIDALEASSGGPVCRAGIYIVGASIMLLNDTASPNLTLSAVSKDIIALGYNEHIVTRVWDSNTNTWWNNIAVFALDHTTGLLYQPSGNSRILVAKGTCL